MSQTLSLTDFPLLSLTSDLTYYSLSLPRSKSPIQLSLAQTISHLSVPKPRSLPQTAETAFLFYSEDLLSSVASLSAEERSILQEIRVKVKIPTPRVGDITTPDGFTLEHTKGGATVTFVSKPSTLADASIEDQVRFDVSRLKYHSCLFITLDHFIDRHSSLSTTYSGCVY